MHLQLEVGHEEMAMVQHLQCPRTSLEELQAKPPRSPLTLTFLPSATAWGRRRAERVLEKVEDLHTKSSPPCISEWHAISLVCSSLRIIRHMPCRHSGRVKPAVPWLRPHFLALVEWMPLALSSHRALVLLASRQDQMPCHKLEVVSSPPDTLVHMLLAPLACDTMRPKLVCLSHESAVLPQSRT